MAQFGLSYEELSRNRHDLIMLSTCMRGQTGPQASFRAFGGQNAAIARLHDITGWPDRPPDGPWGAYTDVIVPRYGSAVLAAALYERTKSGHGQHIDLSQIETAIHFLEPQFLEYEANGHIARSLGHDSDRACPHGIYATQGIERYIAIAVETTEQWRGLCSIAPLDAFTDPQFDGLVERLAKREQIDTILRDWTASAKPFPLAEDLRNAGVPASVALRPTDLYEDPQLRTREFFVTLNHSVMGPTPYDGPATIFSETPAILSKAAPALGEDTYEVLNELLGLTSDEIADFATAGVLT
jgi:benzylsuccinate CoA-transferase BbsF subunit